MTANRLQELCELVSAAKVYDLAQPLEAQIPVSMNHPGFRMALLRRHGDMIRADGGSAANELMVMGGHTGTHLDALCHVSHNGKLFGDQDALSAQSGGRFLVHGIETVAPILCRGVMLDIPALLGAEVLDPGTPITAAHLDAAAKRQAVEVRAGDAVLVRSGWCRYWTDPELFLGLKQGAPGPDESAARWLAEHKVKITGAETIAYECIPGSRGHALLPVHRILLVERGIYIMEAMNLADLARDQVFEFLFVLTPIKVVGATGVPVRPIAVRA